MLEDSGIARDAINRLTALRSMPGVTPEDILAVALTVQITDKSRLASRAAVDAARADAWLAVCHVGYAVKQGETDIDSKWQRAMDLLWAWRHSAE